MIRRTNIIHFSSLVSSLSLLAACGAGGKAEVAPQQQTPMVVGEPKTTPVSPPELLKVTPAQVATLSTQAVHRTEGTALVSEVTLQKSEILNRVFLYGADLQYSAIKDEGMDLTLQAEAVGHWPTRFRLIGSSLQLVVDQTSQFESDINHPERLVNEFQVVRQDDQTVTISITKASPILVTVLSDAKAPAARSSWVRSVKYVAQGNYLMIESSIEGADGSIAEFMESLFPRETLVGANAAAPILKDADNEPLSERFGFLGGGPVYLDLKDGRQKTETATRFGTKPGQTIDWYVTSNIPDQYLPEVRTGIEGWNRYFEAMWGQKTMSFKGKLPADVKIGDPRYNVVNWDSVAEAGAAYESQATDPLSGIQSHSLVYLPLAWVNIGRKYWEGGQLSEKGEHIAEQTEQALARREILGRSLRATCVADASMKLGVASLQSPDDFSRELLKGVLLHEVGHALGLAHNFKGSLSWNSDDPKSMFSTSIMDYNQYNIERGAYDSVTSDKGPLLEYDRQILSVLYNGSKDIKATDPELPTCADDVADSFKDGVDPLCIRYDSGKDPTQQLVKTQALLEKVDATEGATVSLPKAIAALQATLGDATKTTDLTEALKTLKTTATTAKGLVGFYVTSGAQSLSYMTRANVKSLYIFQEGSLPAGYSEDDMRKTALAGYQYVANLETFPAATRSSLVALATAAKSWLAATPAYAALGADDQTKAQAKVAALFDALTGDFEIAQTKTIRARVLGTIVRQESAPFAMQRAADGSVTDYEQALLSILEKELASPLKSGKTRDFAERSAVIPALRSFAPIAEGRAVIARVEASLQNELATVADARQREQVRQLIQLLKAEPKADPKA